MYRRGSSSRIYIGNLPENVNKSEIDDLFHKYGHIREIDVKHSRSVSGTTFAFLEYDDSRDAEVAVERRNGYRFGGSRLRVEFTGDRRPKRNRYKSHGPPKRTSYRVLVTGLPSETSWQDLKDHMRKAGPVGYANIENKVGIVEYEIREDMERSIKKLDKSQFENMYTRCEIRVRRDKNSSYYGDRDRSRSYSGHRHRHSYSRSRSYDKSSRVHYSQHHTSGKHHRRASLSSAASNRSRSQRSVSHRSISKRDASRSASYHSGGHRSISHRSGSQRSIRRHSRSPRSASHSGSRAASSHKSGSRHSASSYHSRHSPANRHSRSNDLTEKRNVDENNYSEDTRAKASKSRSAEPTNCTENNSKVTS